MKTTEERLDRLEFTAITLTIAPTGTPMPEDLKVPLCKSFDEEIKEMRSELLERHKI